MIFTIKKNSHYSDNFFHKLFNSINHYPALAYRVIFDKTCVYSLPGEDQLDINKLFGFSLGFNHHKDSARFGWNYSNYKIALWAYCYINGERKSVYINSIKLDSEYLLKIDDREDYYEFTVIKNGILLDIAIIVKDKGFTTGYRLWPYFGGNNSSPHNMKIQMKEFT